LPINWLLIRINARVIGDSCAAATQGGMGAGAVSAGAIKPPNPFASMPPHPCCCNCQQHSCSPRPAGPALLWLCSADHRWWTGVVVAFFSSAASASASLYLSNGHHAPRLHHTGLLRPPVVLLQNNLALEAVPHSTRCTYRHPWTWPRSRRNHLRPKTQLDRM